MAQKEKFIAPLLKGTTSWYVIIPPNLIKFYNLQEKDFLEISIRKKEAENAESKS